MKRLSIIVPCYNEEAALPHLFARLDAAAKLWSCDYEVLCINDGSRDRTWELLKEQSARDPCWKGICFARNFGHQAAVSAGLLHATGDAAIVIDADLQDPPEEITRLLEKWNEGYHVVYAVRTRREDQSLKKFLAWAFYRVIAMLVPFQIPADAGDFCLLDRKVIQVLNALPERNRYLRGLRAWAGFKQIGVTFERQARVAGNPQYTFTKSLKLALDGIFSFSTVPLRLVSFMGFFVSGLALLGAVFTFLQKIFSDTFAKIGLAPGPGFPTVVISILFLGGVQLIALGILGEYLGRIYEEVKGRPSWIVMETAGLNSPPKPS